MTPWRIFWLLIFAVASLLFFGTAAIITVIGFQDFKDLLTHSKKKETDS